jgi:hypothetical protein
MQQLNAAKDRLGQEYSGALLQSKVQLRDTIQHISSNCLLKRPGPIR